MKTLSLVVFGVFMCKVTKSGFYYYIVLNLTLK